MGRICNYLNELKAKAGYTHQMLSDLTGIPMGTIPKYFAGLEDDAARFDIVAKMVKTLGGSLDELAGINTQKHEAIAEIKESISHDGYTESEQRAILRWAAEHINEGNKSMVAALEARLEERSKQHEKEQERNFKELSEQRAYYKGENDAIRNEWKQERKTKTILLGIAVGLLVAIIVILVDRFVFPEFGNFRRA